MEKELRILISKVPRFYANLKHIRTQNNIHFFFKETYIFKDIGVHAIWGKENRERLRKIKEKTIKRNKSRASQHLT